MRYGSLVLRYLTESVKVNESWETAFATTTRRFFITPCATRSDYRLHVDIDSCAHRLGCHC